MENRASPNASDSTHRQHQKATLIGTHVPPDSTQFVKNHWLLLDSGFSRARFVFFQLIDLIIFFLK